MSLLLGPPNRRLAVAERLRAAPYPAWRMGHILRGWRQADELLRSGEVPARQLHERAVGLCAPALDQFTTVEELLSHHAGDRFRRISDAGPPPAGTVEHWLLDAAEATGDDQRLNLSLVEAAAFWRRACVLLGVPCA